MSAVVRARRAVRRALDAVTAPVGSVLSVRTREPAIALTFDDGPDADVTPRILDALDDHGARATFFVLGTRIARHPDLLAEVLRRGHEVALHGLDHRRLTALDPREAADSIRRGADQVRAATGRPLRWMRPPFGAISLRVWGEVRACGLHSVLWGPSLWDWKDSPDADRAARARQGLAPGAIVLGHDGIAGPADGVPDGTAPALDRAAWASEMMDVYAGEGYRLVTLSELAATGTLRRAARFVR